MLNVEIRNSLANIIRQNGKRIAQDPVGLQTLLRNEAAQYPREIGMIVNAARAGIPKDIEEAGNAIYDLRPRMIEKLVTEQAFPQDVAEWVVETWISALSVADTTAPAAAAPAAPAPVQAAPAAPVFEPAPAPAAPAPAAPQAPYGQAPAHPQFPQYGQFPAQKKGSGKMVAIIVISILVLAGLGVGGYFLFRGKGTTPVSGTTGGTIGGGTTGGANPQDLFSNGGGANGGGPGATGGGPGANGGGPGTDGGANGGGPGTDGGANGGGPGTDGGATGGGPGTNGGGPGTDGGGGGAQTVGGTYGLQADPPQQGLTGTLNINQDMTFILDFAAPDTNGQVSFQMRGKVSASPDGRSIMLTCESATVNGQQATTPANLTTGLAPETASKLNWTGAIPEKMQQNVPGLKLFWAK